MSHESLDLVIAGIGNQPLAFACFVLARMAQAKGLDVQILEPKDAPCGTIAHVRIGQKAPRELIAQGQAHVLIGLEPVDAIKALPYLSQNGVAVCNMPENLTNEALARYFPDVENPLGLLEGYRILRRDALSEAKRLGMPTAIVTILLGMLSKEMPFSEYEWKHAIASSVPRRTLAPNIQGFLLGRGSTDEPLASRSSLVDETDMIKKDDECSDTTM